MVTFTCLECQWTGKKKQVEKHYNRCGGEYFSCIDCGKIFGEDYSKHISCINEQDKYHGKWAKSKKKQKNQINHKQMIQNKNNGKNSKSSNTTNDQNEKMDKNDKKRKLETILDKNIDNDRPLKKQKICDKTINDKTVNEKKVILKKKKILKKILKNENNLINLKSVCKKFNQEMNIDPNDNNNNQIFFQTLWKMGDKITIKL